jgi:DNA-binding response OmpR family regulator
MNILIVEDEKKLATFLASAMQEAGHTTNVAHDGKIGYGMARTGVYDLILLDYLLPGLSGLEICSLLRDDHVMTPVLMLTARADVEDRVAGLDAGADDYLAKPFALDELMARVRALLRRRASEKSQILMVEDLTLNPATREVLRDEEPISLSAREYSLLEYLMRNARRPLTRTMIADHVWGVNFDTESNVIDVYINYLRAKIDAGRDVRLIQTIRNVGYRIG